ncbi:hypothetical protein RRG08_066765 [Elysia crispata]|uniref:Uncharacterized protein n=1 Tax=Elysia crispata TaxID=231223 RepID=A0AAE1CJT0_9GAST|nr:hypothetical protein RRG08_066765 [Elysia crispata]
MFRVFKSQYHYKRSRFPPIRLGRLTVAAFLPVESYQAGMLRSNWHSQVQPKEGPVNDIGHLISSTRLPSLLASGQWSVKVSFQLDLSLALQGCNKLICYSSGAYTEAKHGKSSLRRKREWEETKMGQKKTPRRRDPAEYKRMRERKCRKY